uniref:Uncharacterized protein n=1 Tax=Arundo donax TaxID=35708 RepID=A0A0A9BZQ6_ARUDO
MYITTRFGVSLLNSSLSASPRPKTCLDISITEICMPKQIPRYGTLFSRAYFAANTIPEIPRSPNPPGIKMHAEPLRVSQAFAWASGAVVAVASSRSEAAIHWIDGFNEQATLACRRAFTTDR